MLDQPESTPGLAALGYLPSQVQAMERCQATPGGAIVLAGTVGAGKSTTIATLMRRIPSQRKVITIEDPVEYLIPNALQNTVARDLGHDDLIAFDAKLKTVKRCAMNDLLIGEIRDQVGGRAFIDLAGTGVSLYTTVHASSALLIPERLASELIGVPRDLLSTPGVFKLLVYQRLMPTLCQHCALFINQILADEHWTCAQQQIRTRGWKKRWIEKLECTFQADISRIRFRQDKGCDACRKPGLNDLNGFEGRTVIAELIEPGLEPGFLACLAERDPMELHRWFESRPKAALNDPDMTGKSAFECALYKALVGQIDPRDVEVQFKDINRWPGSRQDAD
jgi:type II secretory ATPase GspE/PulE/Tfp pilus assembly ATPase PilB-like protein